ncbi:MAG TPA: hypothetical protein VJ885_01490 [Thermoanaerobaculia bacterium]|nr:hypothetical protein [Thermoanaerobaculia bacterium]
MEETTVEDFLDDDDARPSTIDDLLDEVLPEELEWDRLVRTYPLPSLAVAAAGGFLLALSHGPAILSAVSGYLSAQVSRSVNQVLGQEIGQ